MNDRTRYTDEIMDMTHDEFVAAWNSGEIQKLLIEELEVDRNMAHVVIEHNIKYAQDYIWNL
jgi:hypothetical protein